MAIERVPVQSVVLYREGKFITPDVDKVFSFTQKEIEEINAVNPAALRKPVVEVVDTASVTTTPGKIEPAQAPASSKAKAESKAKDADL